MQAPKQMSDPIKIVSFTPTIYDLHTSKQNVKMLDVFFAKMYWIMH